MQRQEEGQGEERGAQKDQASCPRSKIAYWSWVILLMDAQQKWPQQEMQALAGKGTDCSPALVGGKCRCVRGVLQALGG